MNADDRDRGWDAEPHPELPAAAAALPSRRAVELGCGEGRQAI
ncbi:hypothetical protein [Pseudonocardia nigra]|nr:hypothetical protein [Pseudonocardia nigra]